MVKKPGKTGRSAEKTGCGLSKLSVRENRRREREPKVLPSRFTNGFSVGLIRELDFPNLGTNPRASLYCLTSAVLAGTVLAGSGGPLVSGRELGNQSAVHFKGRLRGVVMSQ